MTMLRVALLVLLWTITPHFAASQSQEAEAVNAQTLRATPPPAPPFPFPGAGLIKNAWPELRFESVDTARAKLRQGGVENIYVLPPGADPSPTGFAVVNGSDQDVWLYATGPSDMDIVYETPVRGLWHHNRMDPGWPDLVGQDYLKAIEKIASNTFGVTVIYGPAGQPRLLDLRLERVYVDVTVSGTVATIPFVG